MVLVWCVVCFVVVVVVVCVVCLCFAVLLVCFCFFFRGSVTVCGLFGVHDAKVRCDLFRGCVWCVGGVWCAVGMGAAEVMLYVWFAVDLFWRLRVLSF